MNHKRSTLISTLHRVCAATLITVGHLQAAHPASALRTAPAFVPLARKRAKRADALIRDGLKGFPEVIETVFPKAQVQLCIVDLVRHSLELRRIQRAQGSCLRPRANLSRGDARRCRTEAFRVRCEVECEVLAHLSSVATKLGTTRAMPRLPGRDTPGHLHNQRRRKCKYVAEKDHQEPWFVSGSSDVPVRLRILANSPSSVSTPCLFELPCYDTPSSGRRRGKESRPARRQIN